MNVFDLRQRLVNDYARYTRSFIKIADPAILAKVDSELDAGAFWPEPLLQLNPTFQSGGTIDDLVDQEILHPECAKIFRIEPRVELRNTLSNRFSVIEVTGLDRPGLLSEITGTLSDLSLNIASAHITTFGEKVVDTFYVTDLTWQKIDSPARERAIRARLLDTLETEDGKRQTKPEKAAGE